MRAIWPSRVRPGSNPTKWLLYGGLAGLQVVGLLNLGIIGHWLTAGISTEVEIIRFYIGIGYVLAGWLAWAIITHQEFLTWMAESRKPRVRDIALLPLSFYIGIAFWPFAAIWTISRERGDSAQ